MYGRLGCFKAKSKRRAVENAPQYFALVQGISNNLRSIFFAHPLYLMSVSEANYRLANSTTLSTAALRPSTLLPPA